MEPLPPNVAAAFGIGLLLLSYLIVAYWRFGPPPCVLCGGRGGEHGSRCPHRKEDA